MSTNIGSARYNPRVVPDNLSLYLDAGNIRSFDNTSNIWNDISGYSRNGTLLNNPAFVNLGPSSYFTFDGLDDYLTTNYPITATPALGNWTYEIWTELTSFPTALGSPNPYGNSYRAGTLFGAMNNAGAAIYWNGNNSGTACVIYGIIRGNDAYKSTVGFSMQLNKTYQFTLVNRYSNGFFALYINGIFFSGAISPTQEYNAGNVSGLNIGMSRPQVDIGGLANYSYYPGRIKNAKIYGTALSVDQIVGNFTALRGRYGA